MYIHYRVRRKKTKLNWIRENFFENFPFFFKIHFIFPPLQYSVIVVIYICNKKQILNVHIFKCICLWDVSLIRIMRKKLKKRASFWFSFFFPSLCLSLYIPLSNWHFDLIIINVYMNIYIHRERGERK